MLVGLGNPGARYETTRHNVGWMALDRLAATESLLFRPDRRFRAETAEWTPAGGTERVVVVKPLTFMNDSGAAARAVAQFYRVAPEDMVVVYDEMALPLGAIRVRGRGSSAGHNGIKSLIAHMGTDAFPRVRIGVGGPAGDSVAHVLGTFRREEWPAVHEAVALALEAVRAILNHGVPHAMNRFNQRPRNDGPDADPPLPA